MSRPELSDPRFERIVHELRQKAPTAPQGLRERVAMTTRTEHSSRRSLRVIGVRRGLALAAAATVALGLGGALINGLAGSGPRARELGGARRGEAFTQTGTTRAWDAARSPVAGRALALPPGRRLQDYEARMRLRVKDPQALDKATKQAMRDTRSLGGFVSAIDFGTRTDQGDARLVLRVPIRRVQEAIARYSELGTILSQHVAIADLQPQADRLARETLQLRRRVAELKANSSRTAAEQRELQNARRRLEGLTVRQTRLVRTASYATVSLDLTTSKPAAKREEPGRFGTFWDDASSILATELVWLLYALVVAGPFLLLAVIALFAERARRRRGNDALLAHH